ncbi:MAG TPA: hypothetical protein VF082_06440 [Jiangellaceae bacterium]
MTCTSRHVTCALLNVLRYLLWSLMSGLIAAGSSRCGGYDAYTAWTKAGPPVPRCRFGDAASVTRDAARGIAEIEAFLAAHGHGSERVDDPSVRRAENGGPGLTAS